VVAVSLNKNRVGNAGNVTQPVAAITPKSFAAADAGVVGTIAPTVARTPTAGSIAQRRRDTNLIAPPLRTRRIDPSGAMSPTFADRKKG